MNVFVALVAGLIVLGPYPHGGTPQAVADRTAVLVRDAVEATGGRVMSASDLSDDILGTSAAIDTRSAIAALERGKDLSLDLEFHRAVAALESARVAFEAALVHEPDLAGLSETLVHLGAAYLGIGDADGARGAFLALLRYASDAQLDARQFPPEVVQAFDAARREASGAVRGSLTVTSAPPLATVVVNGLRRGEAPLTIRELPLGRHAVRISMTGHRPWGGWVEVEAEGTQIEVHLDVGAVGQILREIRDEAEGLGRNDEMVELAMTLCRRARVESVLLLGLERRRDSYLLTAARVDATGGLSRAWTTLDVDLLSAQYAAASVVGAVLAEGADHPMFADSGHPSGPEPDFEVRLLGMGVPFPEPERVEHVEVPPAVVTFEPIDEPVDSTRRPILGRPWFWVVTVGLFAGGAAAWYGLGANRVGPDELHITVIRP